MNGLLFVRRQLSEVQVGGIPYFHVLRMKSLQRDGALLQRNMLRKMMKK